jgi:hypothetical protein
MAGLILPLLTGWESYLPDAEQAKAAGRALRWFGMILMHIGSIIGLLG